MFKETMGKFEKWLLKSTNKNKFAIKNSFYFKTPIRVLLVEKLRNPEKKK